MLAMFNKLGQGLRWLAEKSTTAASWLGNKVCGTLKAISPAVAHFNPVLGARVGSAGMVMKGVSARGDAGKEITRGGYFNAKAVRRTVDGIRNDAGAVWSAYSAVRGLGNPLERGR